MQEIKINHLAVLVSVIWMFFLGFMWYGPLFGEAWMGMVGLSMEDAEQPSAGIWISNIIGSVAGIYMLAYLFVRMNIQSLVGGLLMGLAVGGVFNLLPAMVNNMFAQAPYGLAWITGGFQTLGWAIAGVILGAWTKKV